MPSVKPNHIILDDKCNVDDCKCKDKIPIGKVTKEERDEIKTLFERKNGLIELTKTITDNSKNNIENNSLYDKIVKDMGKVSINFQGWWDRMSEKYNWEKKPGYKWEINFDTCTIYMNKQ